MRTSMLLISSPLALPTRLLAALIEPVQPLVPLHQVAAPTLP
jgi:hypothetical protein